MLVHEDGTAKADAESFCSVSFADLYHEARGLVSWLDMDESAKEAALRKASDYIESNYSTRWKGFRATQDQALSWPRTDVMIDGYSLGISFMPKSLQRACAELASRAVTAELDPDVGRTVISEKVGEIAVSYDPYGPKKTSYSSIDALLSNLLEPMSGSVATKLIRV